MLKRKSYVALFALCGLWLHAATLLHAQTPEAPLEYQVKAVFISHFAQFVEWPAESLVAGEPVVFGILGPDPFGPYLEAAVQGEQIKGHAISIQRYATLEQVRRCHLLFVHASYVPRMPDIAALVKGSPTLTVSDGAQFIEGGGMILFVTVNGKIRFHVNLAAVEEAGLTISSKLLRQATIVGTKRN